MAEIKTLNLVATMLKHGPPKTVANIAAVTGVHQRSVYRYIKWIGELSSTFNHQLHKKNVNGSRYYHLTKLE